MKLPRLDYQDNIIWRGLWFNLSSKVKVVHVDSSFLNTGGLSAPADSICPKSTHRALCASKDKSHRRSQTLKHTDTNEHRHSTNTNPLVHIRYTIFSSCFSPAFPNGWLNQLCGAWFKSSGMLGCCQLLDRQQGGSEVTGGDQLTSFTTFIRICFYRDESQINGADEA